MLAVAFALRGTLTAASALERDAFALALRERSAELDRSSDEFAPERAAAELFPEGARDVVSPARVREAAGSFLGRADAGPSFVARFRQIAAERVPAVVEPTPSTRETLEKIDSLGIPTAVLCNGWSRIAQREAAWAGFSGTLLVSEDLGVEKPERAAFDALAAHFGMPRDRIWYVGSDPLRDVHPARAAGFSAIWLDSNHATYPPELEPPAFAIARLEELLPPLCEEYTRSLLSLRHVMRTALEWRAGHVVRPLEDP